VLRRRPTTEQIVAWSLTAVVAAFVLWQFFPTLLLRNTTPARGDLGGHLHEAAHLRHHLLPDLRLSGWSQDWFTGYPSLTFYFPLASVLVVFLDLALPFNIAFKVVAASGAVALPVCAYAFGRLNRCDRLTSACLAVAVLPLLFQPSIAVAGGSVGATALGEFPYELSLALGLLVLGLTRAGLRTGRHRALTAALLAATVLLHIVPAAMVVVGIGVAAVLQPTRERLRWVGSVLPVAGILTGFWVVPFVVRTKFTAGPDYAKSVPVLDWLFPVAMAPVVALAVVAVMVRFVGKDEGDGLRLFLTVMAVMSGVAFVLVPSGRLWNGRFLPIWFLWLCLLAGYGCSRLAQTVDRRRQRSARGRSLEYPALACLVLPVLLVVAIVPLWDTRLGRGLLTKSQFDSTTMARHFFEGFERSSERAEYQGLIEVVQTVADERGCGRAHFEWDDSRWTELRLAFLRLIPSWTDGCMPVTVGLYTQSAASFPYVFATNSRLSSKAAVVEGEQAFRRPFDLAAGIADLRLLGVRYFIASRKETMQVADTQPELHAVAQTEAFGDRFWKVYEISDVRLVEPVSHLPVVVPGAGRSRSTWEAAAGRWWDQGNAREVVVATSGPGSWPRHDRASTGLPRRPVPAAAVSRVRIDQDRVSFDVSRTGVPVLVKVSYFPNWRASGADGPWRVTPNQMVVVPTSRTVTLRYGRTPVDHLGWLATLAGVGGLGFLARQGPLDMPEPAQSRPAPERPTPRPPSRPKRKKRR
jgi:hypothetical protein